MKSFLYHLQINIDFANISFYKDLMSFLGWGIIFEEDAVVGFKSETNGDIWFLKAPNLKESSSDDLGVSHVALRVEEQKDIDEVVSFLRKNNVKPLHDTPRHRPEFSSEGQTYYQIMFESPDKVLFEIVYIGSKS